MVFSPGGLDRIAREFSQDVEKERIAGTVSLVARSGKIAHFEAVGWQDREAGIPMRRDTIFRIYSNTKPMTSAAVMILVDEGMFGLDDPVSRFLPALGNLSVGEEKGEGEDAEILEVPARREVTIRDLLTHTAGMTYGMTTSPVDRLIGEANLFDRNGTIADMVEKLGRLPLRYHPGTTWEYSMSCDVLGRLVEVVSGRPFDEFLKERIFNPLKMPDTNFWVPPEKTGRFAADYRLDMGGHARRTGLPKKEDRERGKVMEFLARPSFLSGGGGLVSTAPDCLRFSQMLLNGGEVEGVRVLKPETVSLMLSNHLGPDVSISSFGQSMGVEKFGLGFGVFPAPAGKPGLIYGWYGAAGTCCWVDPGRGLAGILMIQIWHERAWARFRELVYKALIE